MRVPAFITSEFRAHVGDADGSSSSSAMLDGSGPGLAYQADLAATCGSICPRTSCRRSISTSMATSLEARVPYLDNDVIDLALSIPAQLKVRGGVRKWILKKAF